MFIVTGAFFLLYFWVSIVSSQDRTVNTRIVGGNAAHITQFPYQVSLRIRNEHFCGGSIIAAKRILTAAHCVDHYPRDVEIVVGTTSLSSSGERYRVRFIRIHPAYNPSKIWNDIATLETDQPIAFNAYVQPISLATIPPSPHTRVVASGWGLLQNKGQLSDKLQYLDLTILDLETCASIWERKNAVVNNNHVCTTSKVGQGTCSGDSGGPLTDGIRQVGIVSYGLPCAVGFPDVFASVAFYYKWILDQ